MKPAIILTLALTASAAADNSGFVTGEVLIGGWPGYPFGVGPTYIQAYSPSGTYQRDAASLGMAHPHDAIMLDGDVLEADDHAILRLTSAGRLTVFAAGDSEGRPYSALAMDNRRNVLVATLLDFTIRKIDSGGAPLASFVLPSEPGTLQVLSMDLAGDQCTLFYDVGRSNIKKYDICNRRPLPDLADVGSGVVAGKIRVLFDGTILVAAGQRIVRLSPQGSVLQTFADAPGNGWFSISITPDNASFWAGSTGTSGWNISKFDLQTGLRLAGPIATPIPSSKVFGIPLEFILVVGERRAAQPEQAPRRRSVRH